jgi:hypothetical protein
MIYALQPVDGGPVKIGFSEDVVARVKALEAGYRRPMALLGTWEGNREDERAIHLKFAHLRLGRTEQFRPATELMEFLGRPLLVGADPDTVEAIPGPDSRAVVIHLKGSRAFAEWLDQAHEDTSIPKAAIIRIALRLWAEQTGRTPPPKGG